MQTYIKDSEFKNVESVAQSGFPITNG